MRWLTGNVTPPVEISTKFTEIVRQETSRVSRSRSNTRPEFRWARVSPPYPRALDRYVNIQPWNNNRVKLRVPAGHVDYINASPIVLYPSAKSPAAARSEQGKRGQGAEPGPDRYIAMQGPKHQSTNHVWRMVVEQLESPGVIVMLTETHEGGVEKCYPYFPQSKDDPPLEINEHDEFGDQFRATVTCEGIEETPMGDAIELRKLVIRVHARAEPSATQAMDMDGSNGTDAPSQERRDSAVATPEGSPKHEPDSLSKSPTAGIRQKIARFGGFGESGNTSPPRDAGNTSGGSTTPVQDVCDVQDDQAAADLGEERIVWHFLYKRWPDFGVPNLDDLDSFLGLMRLSREKNANPQNPRIVHCSAGVGRSGTFIALEHLMRELDAGVMERYEETQTLAPQLDQDDATRLPALARGEDSDDLIFSTVNHLREQRCTMVQAPAQYHFLYQVLRKLWLEKYGEEDVGEPAAKRLEVDPFIEP